MKNQLENLNAVASLLNQKQNAFSGELANLIQQKQVSVRETTDYVAQAISSQGGTIDLVEASTDRKEGVTTFNGNKFPQNTAKVYDAIEVRVGKGNPADFGAIAFDKAAPAALQNAHLIVKQNDRLLLEKKISDFIPEGTETDAEDKFVELAMPLVLADQQDFDIQVKFPKGSAVGDAATAADTEIVKVAFRAYETSRR